MTRRRLRKRSRQKAKFHKVQDSRSRFVDSKNGNNRKSHLSRSPESVLFESQHVDPLCDGKLSPEIIPKQSGTRSKDDPEVDDGIAAQMIQQSSPISHKTRELDVPTCDFKHDTKCMNDFPDSDDSGEYEGEATKSIIDDPVDFIENYSFSFLEPNNNANRKTDGRSSPKTVDETARQNILGSAISCSDLESKLRDDTRASANIPGTANFDENGSLGLKSNQRRNHVLEMNDCYLLDKTLSMNDNLVCEMNSYLNERSSTGINKLGRNCALEIPHLAVLRNSDERGLAGSPVHRPVGGPQDNLDLDTKKRGTSSGNKRFDVTLEKIGERFTANWREFRKIFAYLRWTSRRTREDAADQNESSLHRYKRFSCVFVSTLSLPTSPSKRETEKIGIPPESTTPRIGLARRRRTTLTFENEGEEEATRHRQPASRADITDPFPLGKKSKGYSFLLDSPSFFEETRSDRIPETTIAFDVELSDRHGHTDSPQQTKYHWDGTRKPQAPQNIATPRDSRSHVFRRRNISRTIIAWLSALCIWLIKKLLHVVNVSYKKMREKLIVPPWSSPWTKKFDNMMETMRSESEMLHVMSEKITQLSQEFVQIRTTTETTLNVLTTEMNVFREASKKIKEDNVILLQEVKKLRETLEEIQIKSSKSVILPSSCPLSSPRSSLPPPPPPFPQTLSSLKLPLSPSLPPPPPPLPSFLPKMHTSESSSIPLPPPLFLSSVSLQSPMPSIQPTTPNSSRSNKTRTPTRKCSTPLFNRPSITVEDLLKVTLRKAPQSLKENRRNTVPNSKGPVVSLEMLRNVKLKSAKRRPNDQTGRSPRNGRIVKSRVASNISLSPILTGSEGNLERILRRVNLNRPRRLLSSSSSFRERDLAKEMQYPLETLTYSQSVLE